MTKTYARPLAMTALAILLAVGTTGCETMSDLDPTGLLSDDSPAPESQFPTDSNQQAAADAATTTPDLASIPTRPATPNASAQANTTQQVTAAGRVGMLARSGVHSHPPGHAECQRSSQYHPAGHRRRHSAWPGGWE